MKKNPNNIVVGELELIKLTQYAYAVLGKSLPKLCVLKQTHGKPGHVEFYKLHDNSGFFRGGKPVGFYFEDQHRFCLRSKWGGGDLIDFVEEELDHILEDILK